MVETTNTDFEKRRQEIQAKLEESCKYRHFSHHR